MLVDRDRQNECSQIGDRRASERMSYLLASCQVFNKVLLKLPRYHACNSPILAPEVVILLRSMARKGVATAANHGYAWINAVNTKIRSPFHPGSQISHLLLYPSLWLLVPGLSSHFCHPFLYNQFLRSALGSIIFGKWLQNFVCFGNPWIQLLECHEAIATCIECTRQINDPLPITLMAVSN